ncbi:MAG TPA: hypothetical protein VGP73_04305 [Thermoanaerobaculia bacterium]
MSRYCLDTSAYSHFKRGDPAVVDLIDRADWLGLPSIALGELWIGFLQKAKVPVLTYDDHFLDIQQVNTLLLPTPSGKH